MNFGSYLEELKKIELLEPEQELRLWQAYKETSDMDARRCLIESYQPLVFKQAMQFRNLDNWMDIIQEGTVGLIEAVENYDYTRGAAFSLYAVHRIRGRMLNFLKKEGSNVCTSIEHVFSEDLSLVDPQPGVAELAEKSFLAGELGQALQRLPERERQVLHGVYLQDLEPKEVAASLDVTPSHIYRLQNTGIRRIRGMLSKLMQNW